MFKLILPCFIVFYLAISSILIHIKFHENIRQLFCILFSTFCISLPLFISFFLFLTFFFEDIKLILYLDCVACIFVVFRMIFLSSDYELMCI